MTDDQDSEPEELSDVMDFPNEQPGGEERWIVLYPEDYERFAVDPAGNVGLRVNQFQAGEIFKLTTQVIAALSHRDAEHDDVIRSLVDELERVLNND